MAGQQTNSGFTLTKATAIGRKVVKYGGLLLITLMVARVGFNAFVAYWKATHPEPPPPPTVGFGVISAPKFPKPEEAVKPTSYRLETASGSLPDFPDRMTVFEMPQPETSLLADQQAKDFAKRAGFQASPQVMGSRLYRWTKNKPMQTTFDLDIVNYHFELTTDFLSRPELLVDTSFPTNFEAVNQVKSYLSSIDLVPSDVATASGEITPLKSLGGKLSKAVSLSDADFLRIDLNRTPIDSQYRMFTNNGYQGTVAAIISGTGRGRESIVDLKYNYNRVDYYSAETYPIITAMNAWQILQAGEGYIVNTKDMVGNQVAPSDTATIRTVQLGYYDSFEEQPYLQPIYVFEGDNDFIGYVPAITPQFLEK